MIVVLRAKCSPISVVSRQQVCFLSKARVGHEQLAQQNFASSWPTQKGSGRAHVVRCWRNTGWHRNLPPPASFRGTDSLSFDLSGCVPSYKLSGKQDYSLLGHWIGAELANRQRVVGQAPCVLRSVTRPASYTSREGLWAVRASKQFECVF